MKNVAVDNLVVELEKHDEMVTDFYDDPMTEAYGAPTGDFQEGFDRKERKILSKILKLAPKDSDAWKLAWDRVERFLP